MSNFTNSPLVVYTKLSPNHSGQRTKPIDMISIHCMAGNCSVEGCGELFASPARQVSSNYGIGSDGRIAMYVEEKNRSWCTSSAAVDQRAITIEVANTTNKEPFPVSDKAYDSLVKLCIDICKRNGIKKLLWEGDRNLAVTFNVARQNMVAHRFFANKSCPGEWLFENFGRIANDVNAKLGAPTTSSIVKPTTTPKPVQQTNVIAGTPEKVIWKFLKSKGLNDYAVAGIMGNLYAESGLIANNMQNGYERKLGYTDDTYTAAVDSNKYKNFITDSVGYGLAQWTYWSRKSALISYAKKVKKSIGDTQMQCEFLWEEMNTSTYKNMRNVLKNATSVKQASDVFLLDFERPADKSETIKNKRAAYGDGFYKKNANGDKTTLPYKVKVNDNTVLNIRKGPGTNYTLVSKISDNGIYTITQEAIGVGGMKWGKLKSGIGWISLDYCIKVS